MTLAGCWRGWWSNRPFCLWVGADKNNGILLSRIICYEVGMTAATAIYFDYWLVFTGDRTPGRHSQIGLKPGPVKVELEQNLEVLLQDENQSAVALHTAELQFIEWVRLHHPEHTLANWEARIGSPEGPPVSRYWSGFYASE